MAEKLSDNSSDVQGTAVYSTVMKEHVLPQAGSAPAAPAAARHGAVNAVLTRALDVTLCVIALAFLAPILVLVTLLVFVTDPGPVFFAHRRIGRGGVAFPCLKFRTMVVNAEERLQALLASSAEHRAEWARDHKLKDDPRITSIGSFLRKSSLDELPQLFNILMGDMSIVGPRPIVLAEVSRYGRYFEDYCTVRPGLTGVWQISGRNDVTYRRRVAMDVAYARTKSVALDMRVILLTIPAVLKAKGSY